MASLLFFIFLTAIITTEAQRGESIVNLGSSLTPTSKSSWQSQSGFYAFGFYQQANGYAVGVFFAGIPEKTVVWTANRDKPPALASVTLNFTSDGRLIMQSAQGIDTAIADPPERAASASMLDSGNFVLYNSDKKIIWQSFESPTNTLLQGQRLTVGNELFSSVSVSDQSTGIFRLKMQTDGNLVQYPVQTTDVAEYAYWASGTDGKGSNVSLCLDDDGRLYLLNSTGTILKNLTQGGYPTKDVVYFMRIDVDGIFRLFSHNLDKNGNFSVIWSSSNNKCDPKGLCGLNGFCTMNDQDANCLCLPDFASVIEGNWSSGCERNFTAESCKSKDGSMKYIMKAVPNTVWEDDSFSSLTILTKDDCEAACLKDCNCEAATYRDGVCRKQKLPLRFGRRVLGDVNNIAFIKVAISTSTINKIEPLGREKYSRKDIMILGISLSAFGLIMSVISAIAIYKNRVRAYRRVSNSGNVDLSMDVSLRSFTYSDLEKMTNGFKEELEEAILEEWAYSCFEALELDKLVSDQDVDKRQLERILKVGLWCILDEPSLRPSMKKVLLMLEGTVDIPIPPSPTSFLSTV
ncbi:hypothetical protein CMV_012557 [Castanea mollissima]|uniref:Bulb-type lectin domain-containing protein n=1 Tax=Castanea mollissima TaxID=60419 RepID=A0A8J4R113_9ROSI|nr:hypothetical protein CMV_012557 [Castanea mollissima]